MAKSPTMYDRKLYGTATVGTKGQVVIPADAREELHIAPGDRLYVIGAADSGFLGFLKEDALEAMMQHLNEQVESFRAIKQKKDEEQE
jgi:AbrB family looped-hinge helix DNA binding protein